MSVYICVCMSGCVSMHVSVCVSVYVWVCVNGRGASKKWGLRGGF